MQRHMMAYELEMSLSSFVALRENLTLSCGSAKKYHNVPLA